MQTCGKYIAGLVLIANSIFAREYGLPVGSSMPDFVLQDQNGEAHRLRGLLGPKGAMILFVRSAEWCPYCKSQLVELEQNKKDFRKLGVNVLAVSYDNVTKLHSFAEHRGIRFPLLSDSGSGLIRAVGVLNDAIPRTDPYFGSSYPCVFVLNEKGVILAKYFEEDPRLTRVFTNLLTHHFGAAPASRQTEVEGRQLKLIATTSHSLVTAGQRVSLTLDIDLKPNMHVYAPGVDGYIPIEWRIKQSDATSVHEVAYPRSETIRLEAIDETVPVYRGRFRLRSNITLANDAALRRLVDRQGNFRVEGVLRYQACDNRTCYAPQELPMKWTFHYVGFD